MNEAVHSNLEKLKRANPHLGREAAQPGTEASAGYVGLSLHMYVGFRFTHVCGFRFTHVCGFRFAHVCGFRFAHVCGWI